MRARGRKGRERQRKKKPPAAATKRERKGRERKSTAIDREGVTCADV
jgi:hypothetical protein